MERNRRLAESLPETTFAHILNTMISEGFKKPFEIPCKIGTPRPKAPAERLRYQFYVWRRRIRENPENYPDHFYPNVERIKITSPFLRNGEYILTLTDGGDQDRDLLELLADRLGLNTPAA